MRTQKHTALVPEIEPEAFIRGWQAVVVAEQMGRPLPITMMEGMNAVGRKHAMSFGLRLNAVFEMLDDPRIAEWTNPDGVHVAVLMSAATAVLSRKSMSFDAAEFFQNVSRRAVEAVTNAQLVTEEIR
jgi:hypothetical protein